MTRALVVHQTGGPDAMRWQDWPVAAPGQGQIAVRQEAIGVNFIDTYQRSGLYTVPAPFVAGNEGAGTVTAIGPGVTEFKPGDRVAYQG
ncbi:MAG TPA: alcohol dehydrogenase catalytic domain-containing protein, partial [Devosia sp.]|nr:alcohol dehydrogenase catalytic domain-containing protein [Devosia sp.]